MSTMRYRQNRAAAWILALPLLMFFAVLLIWPIYLGVKTALSNDLLSQFQITSAGLSNFKALISEPNFWLAIRFTLIFAVVATTVELALGFAIALLFDRSFPGKKTLFSLILIPIMIAPSLMAVMFRLLLNENIGIIPGFLNKIGIHFSLFDQHHIFFLLVGLDVMQYTAFTFLLIYSSLQGVSGEIYESAAIDGASYRQVVSRIIIPIIKPALAIVALLRFLDSIRTFDSIYILTGGGPGTTTETIGIYIYKTAFITGDFGMASSAAIVLVLMLVPFMPWIIKQFRLTGTGK
jgi:multiple sugar transport system permease protein